ncbi:hypothetical protein EON80_13725 [bacterium]|nr:MAG: hypothetical protein EON80_13725 [bacterium]
MSAISHLEWTEPPAVLEYQKVEVKKVVRDLWWVATKWGWPLWIVASALLFYWGPKAGLPSGLQSFYLSFFLLGLLFPTGFTLVMSSQILLKLLSKGDKFELNSKGIFSRSAIEGFSLSWKRLGVYSFEDHSQVAGIRFLKVETKPIKALRTLTYRLSFDPAETSESEMRAVMEQFAQV